MFTDGVLDVDLQYEKANAMRREKNVYLRNGLRFGTDIMINIKVLELKLSNTILLIKLIRSLSRRCRIWITSTRARNINNINMAANTHTLSCYPD